MLRMVRLQNKKCSEAWPNQHCSGPEQYQYPFQYYFYRLNVKMVCYTVTAHCGNSRLIEISSVSLTVNCIASSAAVMNEWLWLWLCLLAVTLRDPDNSLVLIEGLLFRASYLGSTQLTAEHAQLSKAVRMMQAQEAVGRIKVCGARVCCSDVQTEDVSACWRRSAYFFGFTSLQCICYIQKAVNVDWRGSYPSSLLGENFFLITVKRHLFRCCHSKILQRCYLVLRWATVSGFNSRCQTFISVCNQPATQGQLSLPSLRGW